MNKRDRNIRRLGFVKDQEGIMTRYMHESSFWNTHLENTRNFISGSFAHSEAETIAVLGSGWLLDVPLDSLLSRFKHVYLVDIHHPVQIRKKTAGLKQVELIEEDLTGGAIEQIPELIHMKKHDEGDGDITRQISLTPPLQHIRPDIMISVNLLNQLDIIICDYLSRKGHFQQQDLIPFRAAIQAFHLKWILKKPGCLVTDTKEEVTDRNENITSKALLYTDLPEGIRKKSWWWYFDTRGTYHPGSRTRMEVRAIEWP